MSGLLDALKDPATLEAVKVKALAEVDVILKTATPEMRRRVIRDTISRLHALGDGNAALAEKYADSVALDLVTIGKAVKRSGRALALDVLWIVLDAVTAITPGIIGAVLKALRLVVK